ncbi:DinB family protein [Pontibacter sp. SGAir0037]|uniref:DinB family protein n=1 Tax=Pontibacter sp. SGAir0037 TaxID=2571030 RepID=UPI0010CCC2C2|nr:DinB family protein [Pontibacter sp. SGAir0037]QCR21042.1 DNA damage-inducible protein DinB [Pontibacter sp. SGAir0037]
MNEIKSFPAPTEYADFYKGYVAAAANAGELLAGLEASKEYIAGMVQGLSEEQLNFRYQPEKWSVKEVLVHMIDTERIFAYRALRFARQDKTELAGFDQDNYVVPSKAKDRAVSSILAEYAAVRQATIELFKSFDEEMLLQEGIANKNPVTVRAIGYIILGHEMHHLNILQQRYLAV